MNINDMFPSKYLKHSDLKGKVVPVTISHVDIETLGQGNDKQDKPIVYFEGKEKGLALNKINGEVIASAYGPETDGWTGKPIELYPDKTQFKGEVVDCIRVRKPLEQADGDDEIPF